MKAWLAFYVTENGERKSKTFSTRKLGMEVSFFLCDSTVYLSCSFL